MRKPVPWTHNGVHCNQCTNSTTVHANNVHFTTNKMSGKQAACEVGCEHPTS